MWNASRNYCGTRGSRNRLEKRNRRRDICRAVSSHCQSQWLLLFNQRADDHAAVVDAHDDEVGVAGGVGVELKRARNGLLGSDLEDISRRTAARAAAVDGEHAVESNVLVDFANAQLGKVHYAVGEGPATARNREHAYKVFFVPARAVGICSAPIESVVPCQRGGGDVARGLRGERTIGGDVDAVVLDEALAGAGQIEDVDELIGGLDVGEGESATSAAGWIDGVRSVGDGTVGAGKNARAAAEVLVQGDVVECAVAVGGQNRCAGDGPKVSRVKCAAADGHYIGGIELRGASGHRRLRDGRAEGGITGVGLHENQVVAIDDVKRKGQAEDLAVDGGVQHQRAAAILRTVGGIGSDAARSDALLAGRRSVIVDVQAAAGNGVATGGEAAYDRLRRALREVQASSVERIGSRVGGGDVLQLEVSAHGRGAIGFNHQAAGGGGQRDGEGKGVIPRGRIRVWMHQGQDTFAVGVHAVNRGGRGRE